MLEKLTPRQIQLLRDYVRAKRQFVEAEAFKKNNREAVLEILAQVGLMYEIDDGILWAADAFYKNGAVYRLVKFEDKRHAGT